MQAYGVKDSCLICMYVCVCVCVCIHVCMCVVRDHPREDQNILNAGVSKKRVKVAEFARCWTSNQ